MAGMDLAGHRTAEPHDCFMMNCKDLGLEVQLLRSQIVELATEVERLQAIIDGDDGMVPDPSVTAEAIQAAIRAKGGDVGTITGPPIVGTTDRINAGPARLKPGEEPPPQAVYDMNGRINPEQPA
jgi:hypothetical protein